MELIVPIILSLHGAVQLYHRDNQLRVELHGGQIDFTSEEGVGTTFTIRMPLVSADTESASSE